MNNNAPTLHQELAAGGPLARLLAQASQDVRRLIGELLRSARPQQIVTALSQTAHQNLEQGVNASPLVVLRQCGSGCSACCHTISADITPLEAIVVAEHLLSTADASTLHRVKSRLHLNTVLRANMTAEQRARTRLPCGLLGDDGLCSVYAARPLVCAGVFSLSKAACEASARHEELAQQNIPLDRHAKAWTIGVSGGLQHALVAAGLDGNLYELNSIVLCALVTEGVAERWLRGEDVFAHCVCTDAHSPPRVMREVRRADAAHAAVPSPSAVKTARRARAKELKRKN